LQLADSETRPEVEESLGGAGNSSTSQPYPDFIKVTQEVGGILVDAIGPGPLKLLLAVAS
jgi:hypothetical protein